jgi:hypothetical protein
MNATKTQIKIGDKGHGTVNGYPPTTWRFVGKRGSSWMLEHVKHPSQSAAFAPQGVDWATVERVMNNPR